MGIRKHFRLGVLAVLACAVVGGFFPARNLALASPPATPHPSVVLITLDTVRADHLACYDYHRIMTPSIDGMARDGIRYTHAYAQVPLTLPSHTVIMTGTYPMFNGVRDLTSPGLNKTLPTLAETLRHNGYRTAAFVSSFVLNSMWGLNRGFDVYDDATDAEKAANSNPSLLERRGDQTMARALAWLDAHSDRPFFLWVHLYDPHSPYRPPEPYFSRYAGHLYDGEIAFDDAQLGLLFARLRQRQLYDSSLIVLASDHGESLGEHGEAEHGFFIYNATLHVPLIVKLPVPASGGRVVNDPVGLVDLAPTIVQICGIERDHNLNFQGHPLPALQSRESPRSERGVYAESYYPRDTFGWHELRALMTSRYKYIDAPRPELYDLERDWDEQRNLAAGQSALALGLREQIQTLEGRYANASPARKGGPLDSETLEKLRSLGYVGYKAPGAGDDSIAQLADPKDKIQVLNQMLVAGDLRTQHHFAESDKILASLEQSEPALYILPFERGETLLDWGRARESREEFRKALKLNPTFDQAWVALGRAAFLIGENADAAEAYRLALGLNPGNYLARRSLARVYWRLNRPAEAEGELARVAMEHPDFVEARAEHGVMLAKIKKYREAITELRAAADLGYHDSVLYYYLGLSYSEAGDAALAIGAFQKAVVLDPNYADAYMRLALQYRKAGELAKARQYYQKTCKLSEQLCREFSGQF